MEDQLQLTLDPVNDNNQNNELDYDFEDFLNEELKTMAKNNKDQRTMTKENEETKEIVLRDFDDFNENDRITPTKVGDDDNDNTATIPVPISHSNSHSRRIATNLDFEINGENPIITISDNCNKPALNDFEKIQKRKERFANADIAKIAARKKRFASCLANNNNYNINSEGLPPPSRKRAKFNDADRAKIIERTQKFGTKIPQNMQLTFEEKTKIYSKEFSRAERFGTQHLLPKHIRVSEFQDKKKQRRKRFGTPVDAHVNVNGSGSFKKNRNKNGKEKKWKRKVNGNHFRTKHFRNNQTANNDGNAIETTNHFFVGNSNKRDYRRNSNSFYTKHFALAKN